MSKNIRRHLGNGRSKVNDNDNDNDKHLFDIMATSPKSTYVTINISTEHVTVY